MSRVFSVPVYILPSLNIPFFSSSSSSSSSSAAPSSSSPTAPTPLAAAITQPFSAASASASASTTAPLPKPTIARAAPDTLRCNSCSSQLAFASQIISRQFTGRRGHAILVSPPAPGTDLANVAVGRSESRLLATGGHTVADITCTVCAETLGWKYVDAEHKSQHYKIGCFILELKCVVEQRAWEDAAAVRRLADEGVAAAAAVATATTSTPTPAAAANAPTNVASPDSNEADMASAKLADEWVDVQFDSSDERECDELFSGRWSADVVAKRRAKKGLFGK